MAAAQPWLSGALAEWAERLSRRTHPSSPADAASPETSVAATPPGDFDAFFTRHERALFGYLLRMTGDEQTARDLSQETFLRAWQHFEQIRDYDHPAAWLFRVASNLAISHLRRRSSPVGSAKLLGDDDSPARSDPAMRFIESNLVEQTLLEMPPKQRAALVLREVYGLSCEEIGEVLGLSRDAVKMTLWRGREQFRARYRKGNAS